VPTDVGQFLPQDSLARRVLTTTLPATTIEPNRPRAGTSSTAP